MIAYVLFDLDQTIGEDRHLEMRVLRAVVDNSCRLKPSDTELLAALMDFRTGKKSHLAAICDGLKKWQPQEPVIDLFHEYKQRSLAEAPQFVHAFDDTKNVLQALKAKKIPYAMLTNGWQELQALKACLMQFDGPVFVSETLQACKPQRLAFEKALKQANFDARSTLYVGDSPENDVAGAKGAGLLAAWYNRGNHLYPAGLPPPDFTIHALHELIPLLP